MDLLDEITSWCVRTPDRVAHVWRGEQLSYAELRARAGALAAYLHGTLRRGDPVVVFGHKQSDLIACFLACIEAGHPYVPIDAGLPASRIETIIRHSGAAIVLAPGDAPAVTGLPIVAGVDLSAVISAHAGERPPPDARMRPAENVYIMYTSGSTGAPKGVQITLANLTGFVEWMRDVHPIGTGRRFLDQAPFSFDLSIMDLYLSLVSGGTLYSIDRAMIENPLELRDVLPAADVEIWVSTPSFGRLCLGDRAFNGQRLPSLACFLFCGEALDAACVRELHARFPRARIYNLYGPTEATVAVTSVLVDAEMARAFPTMPLGLPRPDTRIELVNGEIVIEGPCVSPGYLCAPELTAGAFTGQRYRTGDAGRYVGDHLVFGGRLDFQVKLFGHRIELEDVAANLAALPAVDTAVVLPVEVEGRCEALVAFVVLRDGVDVTADTLRAELAMRVPSYMVPREIRLRAMLPMTVNGKIDRAALAAELR